MENNLTPLLRKIFFASLLLFLFVLIGAWIFSPYKGYGEGKIKSKVNIEMPCEVAFNYLGNSNNARIWSVFVDFIDPIESEIYKDGQVGSKRICYTQSDKEGFHWEEEILEWKENEYRKLSCYNFQNLFIKAPVLITEQIYIEKGDGCAVVFTLDFKNEPTFLEYLKLKFSSYRIQSIFDQNLVNISSEIAKDKP